MEVYKYIELIGVSEKSWEDAVKTALSGATKTVRNIVEIEVVKLKADVEGGEIKKYKAVVRVLFRVERP